MLVHFLSAFVHSEEYFDSEEWEEIEEKTVERGTELLNVFLYINEANDADAEISIGDFLNEFLLFYSTLSSTLRVDFYLCCGSGSA